MEKGVLAQSYEKIKKLVLKLRRVCSNPDLNPTPIDEIKKLNTMLINSTEIVKKKYKEEIIEKIKKNDIGDCPVCLEKIDDAVITSCLHILCRLCMRKTY